MNIGKILNMNKEYFIKIIRIYDSYPDECLTTMSYCPGHLEFDYIKLLYGAREANARTYPVYFSSNNLLYVQQMIDNLSKWISYPKTKYIISLENSDDVYNKTPEYSLENELIADSLNLL